MSDNIQEKLDAIIDDAVSRHLKNSSLKGNLGYSSIEEYRRVTGKKFRRTRDQMKRNISPEEAFNEFLDKNNT